MSKQQKVASCHWKISISRSLANKRKLIYIIQLKISPSAVDFWIPVYTTSDLLYIFLGSESSSCFTAATHMPRTRMESRVQLVIPAVISKCKTIETKPGF